MSGILQSMFQQTPIPVLEQVVRFAQARHALLAGNIANLDTPGYQPRDLSVESFQDRLREAIEARRLLAQPATPGVPRPDPAQAMRQVEQVTDTILYHDGSRVGLEEQIAEITKNQAMHNLAIALLNSQFRLLQAAISERV